MSILVIAEKPSVCNAIADVVGAREFVHWGDKGFEFGRRNSEYICAHAAGHLYSIGYPVDYGYSKSFADSYAKGELPMFPERFKFIPAPDPEEFKERRVALREYLVHIINSDEVTGIIEATDAAREGELIFREIYYYANCTKPVKRLWVSSITEDAIKEGLANLKPMTEYDNIYKTAKLRQELDWIVGMNFSRLYTALNSNSLTQIGRVKTPLLSIIVNRDEEIERFTPHTSYKLVLNGLQSENEYETEAEAKSAAENSIGKTATVEEAKKAEKSENRPLLYSLATLQMDANAVYGFTAQQTLDAAQALYEDKLTTYPRTDSEYLSDDMKGLIEPLVKKLSTVDDFKANGERLLSQGLNIDNRVINNEGISDHHAIIPNDLNNIDLSKLSDSKRKIYSLIVNRLFMALDKPYRYTELTFKVSCEGVTYKGRYTQPIELGFRQLKLKTDEDKEEENTSVSVPAYAQGDTFTAENIKIKECVSKPPKHYTDRSLLSVMSNIDNRIDDAELKKAVKGKGLGTSATRAGVIEELIQNKTCERVKKNIVSTQYGRELVHSLPAKVLSVEMTAEWEQKFEEIASGNDRSSELVADIKKYVASIIDFEKGNTGRKPVINPYAAKSSDKREEIIVGKCWRCGADVADKGAFYGCLSYKSKEERGCGFRFSKKHPREFYLGEINTKQASELLDHKKIQLDCVSQEGKKYKADWELQDTLEFVNVVKCKKAEKEVIGKCPWCGKNIYEGNLNFYCESGRDGCGFSIWKEDKYHKVNITAAKAKDLLNKGYADFKHGNAAVRYKLIKKEVNGKTYVNLEEVK